MESVSESVRLYFRLDRLAGRTAVGVQESVLCRLGQHRTKDPIYNAIGMGFDKNKHLMITVFTSCESHVPAGSWVEGRDKSDREPDKQGDKISAYWERKLYGRQGKYRSQ